MTGPRIASLFTGTGALDMAAQAVFGGEMAWHCQFDPEDKHQFAAHLLAHHWPGVPNLGDISAVDWQRVLDEYGPIDILTGGFPCTDLSLAGQRAGLHEGTRSGLWIHMARAIQVLRPSIVIIENVRGLLSAPAHSDVEPCPWCLGDTGSEPPLRALGAVLADLAELGLDAEWVGLPASSIGAPHERWREFVLAWPADAAGPGLEVGWEGRPARLGAAAADADDVGGQRDGAPGREPERHAAGAGRDRAVEDSDVAAGGERRLAAPGQAEGRGSRSDAGRRSGAPVADAVGGAVREQPVAVAGRGGEAVAGLAGTEVAADASCIGRVPAERDVQPGQSDAEGRGRGTGSTVADAAGFGWREGGAESARLGGGSDAPVGGGPAPSDADVCGRRIEPGIISGERPAEHLEGDRPAIAWGAFEPAIRRWEAVLGQPAPRPVDDRGRLSAELPEWMMGLPTGHITAVPAPPGMSSAQLRNAQLKAAGNGVVPQQAEAALRLLLARVASFSAAA